MNINNFISHMYETVHNIILNLSLLDINDNNWQHAQYPLTNMSLVTIIAFQFGDQALDTTRQMEAREDDNGYTIFSKSDLKTSIIPRHNLDSWNRS